MENIGIIMGFFQEGVVQNKNRTRTVIIILAVIALAITVSLVIINHKAKVKIDNEEQIMYLSLLQAENAFRLGLEREKHEGLSNIEDLNTLLEPTNATTYVLKWWEIVHQIDPEYPYPEIKIEEQDWMGMNHFLHEDGYKADMIYDENNNIDSDVFDYIMSGTLSSHPVVEEAIERMEK